MMCVKCYLWWCKRGVLSLTIMYACDLPHKLEHPTYSYQYRLKEVDHHSYTLTESEYSREYIHHTKIQRQTEIIWLATSGHVLPDIVSLIAWCKTVG